MAQYLEYPGLITVAAFLNWMFEFERAGIGSDRHCCWIHVVFFPGPIRICGLPKALQENFWADHGCHLLVRTLGSKCTVLNQILDGLNVGKSTGKRQIKRYLAADVHHLFIVVILSKHFC